MATADMIEVVAVEEVDLNKQMTFTIIKSMGIRKHNVGVSKVKKKRSTLLKKLKKMTCCSWHIPLLMMHPKKYGS